jgi:HEXXH motif-containing protein
MSATHRLSPRDLRALVTGEDAEAAVGRLRTAELSKHKVLLAAIMRMAGRVRPADHARTLTGAYRLLDRVEASDGSIVRDVLASPQFGAWAAGCVHRLSGRAGDDLAGGDHAGGAVSSADLGQLAAFAATAAFRAGLPFEIEVPLRDGAVTFPALGTARPGADTALAWGRACRDARGGRVCSPVSSVYVPAPGEQQQGTDGGWSGLPRFVMNSAGLRLDVVLDNRDPFLYGDGTARAELRADDVRVWQGMLARAWSILATDHYPLACVTAGTVRTVVPLEVPSPTRSAMALAGRGQIKADLGRYEYALDDLDRALRLPLARDAEADARSARALALAGLGRVPEAERELSATFQLAPGRARTRLRAARIAAILGHWDEVQAEIERALAGQPSLSSVERESAKRMMESIL